MFKSKIKKEENKGFALLFSVLIASLLLTIGLSIFSIALKELAISTASRQSIHAFYAADSGRECALYWDIQRGMVPTLIAGETGGTINCAERSMNLSNTSGYIDSVTTKIPPSGSETDAVSIDPSDSSGPNFFVTITKSWHDLSRTKIDTTIVAAGHDSIGSNRIEREIKETY